MIIEQSAITKLVIKDLEQLDPITVFAEDFGNNKQGKIIVECYGKTWSAYWPAMGASLMDFFISAGDDYILNCFSPHMKVEEPDYDELTNEIRRVICNRRRQGCLMAHDARELYDIDSWAEYAPEHPYDVYSCPELVSRDAFDGLDLDDIDMPMIETADHAYLKRIITAVKAAFTELKSSESDGTTSRKKVMDRESILATAPARAVYWSPSVEQYFCREFRSFANRSVVVEKSERAHLVRLDNL